MATEFKSCSVDERNCSGSKRGRRSLSYLDGGTKRGEPLRFIHEVAMNHTGDECLVWPFGKNQDGRGRIWVNGKMVLVHRYTCEIANGPPPSPNHEAAHKCGKGHEGCIAPGHLGWKTPTENQADRLLHGTHNRGERQGRSKLTESDVREILSLKGVEKQRDLAKRFGVIRQTVSQIHAGKIWGWLSDCGPQAVAKRTQIR